MMAPGAHHQNPVGERQRLVHVVNDEDERGGAALKPPVHRLRPQAEQDIMQLMSCYIVQRPERLIKQ